MMNENIKEIYLHIGLEKTGSSSIQNTLYFKKNRTLLLNKGFLYPVKSEIDHSASIVNAFCDKPEKILSNKLKDTSIDEIKTYINSSIYFLEKEINNTRASNIILSGEWITKLTKQNLIKLKKYLLTITNPQTKISIIVYVRDPINWAVSKTQEHIKDDKTKTSALIITKQTVQTLFQKNISKFVEVFGKSNIHLFEFEKVIQSPFGPAGHFLTTIGFDKNQIHEVAYFNKNQSISQVAADLISYIHMKAPLLINGKLNKRRYWGDHHYLYNISGKKYDIPIGEKHEIYEKSIEDCRWLKLHFNVDYTQKKLFDKEKNEDYLYDQKICQEIETAYIKTSKVIRKLIYQYFLEEINEKKMTKPNKKKFLKTLKKIDERQNRNSLSLRSSVKILRDYFVIKKSGLFDKKYYTSNIEKFSILSINPLFHYLLVGATQGKNPSNDFNTNFYFQHNHDVRHSDINPLAHYILYGKKEGREIQKKQTQFSFVILSEKEWLLNLVYNYFKWHPLVYICYKQAKLKTLELSNKEIHKKLECYQKIPKNSEQKIAGNLMLIKNDFQAPLRILYDYNPQMKIIFLHTQYDSLERKIEEQLKNNNKESLFLSIAINQNPKISDKIKDEIFQPIFFFLGIEPWKTFV